MELSRNVFKQALKQRRLQIGLWSSLASNIGAEIIADAGFDWVLLDTEHSPNEVPNLLSQLQALERGTATPVIRPAWNDPVLIKRVLKCRKSIFCEEIPSDVRPCTRRAHI